MNPVVICGMHRSGTSMLAQVAHLLGLDFGPAEELMPATVDNPEGYFENLAVTRLHDDLLAHLGGTWDRPPTARPPLSSLEPFLARGRAWAARMATPGRPWAWKDPRTSLFLPFWREVLGQSPRLLICLRHPEEVAASLRARGDLNVEPFALWLAYNDAAAADAEPAHTLWLNHQTLFAAPGAAVEIIAEFLQLNPEPAQRRAAAQAINPFHRRKQATNWQNATPATIRERYAALAAHCWQPPAPETADATRELAQLKSAYQTLKTTSEESRELHLNHLAQLKCTPLECRVYWAAAEKGALPESQAAPFGAEPQTTFHFTLPAAGRLRRLRLDVGNRPGEFLIEALELADASTGQRFRFGPAGELPWSQLRAAADCATRESAAGLAVLSYGEDPVLKLEFPVELRAAQQIELTVTVRYDPNENAQLRAWVEELKIAAGC